MSVIQDSSGKSNQSLADVLEDHIRTCGDEVIVVVPDAALEEVGETLLIATHTESDRKTVGKLCFQESLKFFLRSLPNPPSIVIT